MRTIGQTLRERREELGFSLQLMSEKTRVPIANLKAIEEGDLKYFEKDISYVKFYVRYYCTALHLDFEDFRVELDKSLDEYSNTSSMLKMVELENIENRIKDRSKSTSTPRKNRRKFRKLDFSFISFIAVIAILVISLVLVFGFFVLPKLLAAKPADDKLISDEIPQPIEKEPETETPTEAEVPKVLAIEKTGKTSYVLTGFAEDQEVQMLINFKSNAYVGIVIDGTAVSNPAKKLYNVGSTLDLKFNAKAGMIMEVYIGWMNGNTLTLNGLEVVLDDAVAKLNGSVTLTFTMKGDSA